MIIKPLFTVDEPGFKGSGNTMLALAPAQPLTAASLSEPWLLGAQGLAGGSSWCCASGYCGGSICMDSWRFTAPRGTRGWGPFTEKEREAQPGVVTCSVTELLKCGVHPSGNSPLLPLNWPATQGSYSLPSLACPGVCSHGRRLLVLTLAQARRYTELSPPALNLQSASPPLRVTSQPRGPGCGLQQGTPYSIPPAHFFSFC